MTRCVLLFLSAAVLAGAADEKSVPLFNGRDLEGWHVCNGKAKYEVQDGTITGTTVEGSPNSFLCTNKEYGDFVLEFEVKTDPVLNSGVQIRSHRYDKETVVNTFDGKKTAEHKQPADRVYGYQVEISNEQAGTLGGIYDEARRGWINNIASDPTSSKALKDNDWNRYRIVAMGDSIKTWVNGVACADLVDPVDQTGFIGLQVHAFKGEKPAQVRWRNIQIRDLGHHVWRPLWNGRSLDGWNPRGGANWTIENGALHAVSTPGEERAGFLVSDASFKDATLRVKFRIAKGNSGFFVRADPQSLAAYEVEIDEAARTGGFWETGGRNWVTGPEDNAAVKANDWNDLTASVHGHRIVFHLNGVKTVDLPNDTQGRLEGRIALQCHARRQTDVWFKDIEVLEPER